MNSKTEASVGTQPPGQPPAGQYPGQPPTGEHRRRQYPPPRAISTAQPQANIRRPRNPRGNIRHRARRPVSIRLASRRRIHTLHHHRPGSRLPGSIPGSRRVSIHPDSHQLVYRPLTRAIRRPDGLSRSLRSGAAVGPARNPAGMLPGQSDVLPRRYTYAHVGRSGRSLRPRLVCRLRLRLDQAHVQVRFVERRLHVRRVGVRRLPRRHVRAVQAVRGPAVARRATTRIPAGRDHPQPGGCNSDDLRRQLEALKRCISSQQGEKAKTMPTSRRGRTREGTDAL